MSPLVPGGMEGHQGFMPPVGSLVAFAVLTVALTLVLVRLFRLEREQRRTQAIAVERERRAATINELLHGDPLIVERQPSWMQKARERGWGGPLAVVAAVGFGLAGAWRRLVDDPQRAALAAVAVISGLAIWSTMQQPPERPDDRAEVPPTATPTAIPTPPSTPTPTVSVMTPSPTGTIGRTSQRTEPAAATGQAGSPPAQAPAPTGIPPGTPPPTAARPATSPPDETTPTARPCTTRIDTSVRDNVEAGVCVRLP